MSGTPLKKLGIVSKLSSFMIGGIGSLITLALGFLFPPLWIALFFTLGLMAMSFGYRAKGRCPLCSEYIEVTKKRGGIQCPGCKQSLVIRDQRLVPAGHVTGAPQHASRPATRGRGRRLRRKPWGLIVLGTVAVAVILAVSVADDPSDGDSDDKKEDAAAEPGKKHRKKKRSDRTSEPSVHQLPKHEFRQASAGRRSQIRAVVTPMESDAEYEKVATELANAHASNQILVQFFDDESALSGWVVRAHSVTLTCRIGSGVYLSIRSLVGPLRRIFVRILSID